MTAAGTLISKEIVHAITSLDAERTGPDDLAHIARRQWGIESVHWPRDTAYARRRSGMVRPVLIVVGLVLVQDLPQVRLVSDEAAVQDLTAASAVQRSAISHGRGWYAPQSLRSISVARVVSAPG